MSLEDYSHTHYMVFTKKSNLGICTTKSTPPFIITSVKTLTLLNGETYVLVILQPFLLYFVEYILIEYFSKW